MTRPREVIRTKLYDIIVEGVNEGDEVFTAANYGAFNVSRFRLLLHGKPHRFSLVQIPLTPDFLKYIRTFIAIDDEHVRSMSIERRDDPILMVQLEPHILPREFVIDGHHRVVRRFNDGLSFVEAWLMPGRMLEQIRVKRTKVRR